jgi:serine/threonine protein kinase
VHSVAAGPGPPPLGPFPPDLFRDLAGQLLDAVAYLHAAGITHANIRPEAIAIAAASSAAGSAAGGGGGREVGAGAGLRLTLVDFGDAVRPGDASRSPQQQPQQPQQQRGRPGEEYPAYRSPEMVLGGR